MKTDKQQFISTAAHSQQAHFTKTQSERWLEVERRRDEFERKHGAERTDAYNRVIAGSGVDFTSEHAGKNPYQDYERLKSQLPADLSSAEYEVAVRDIARRCGV